MKKILLVFVLPFTVFSSFGQWLTTGTPNAATVYTNGNVGVGTTSPTAPLEVYSPGIAASTLIYGGIIGSKNDNNALNLVGGTPIDASWPNQHGGHIRLGGSTRTDDGKNVIQFLQNGVERMRVNDGGTVAIGTTSPNLNYKFEVSGMTNLVGNFTDTDPGASWNATVSVRNSNSSIGTYSRLVFVSATDGLGGISVQKSGATNGDMHFHVRNGGGYYLTPMLIKSNGNVGIGTISPSAPLHIGNVDANIRIGAVNDPGNSAIAIGAIAKQLSIDFSGYRDIAPDQIGARISALRFNNYSPNQAYVQSTGLSFYTNPYGNNSGTSDLQESMRITPDGRIGIGTTNPGSFKLAVNGKIWGTEIQVALTNPGPDYVFEKDYALPTLESVKTYIDQNKHLPDVPSAKEMEANGINLSEMNMLLLKKVEELTLYVIEMDKKIMLLQIENKELKQNR